MAEPSDDPVAPRPRGWTAGPIDLGSGTDRACLLLHGWLGTPRDFGGLPEALAAGGARVRAIVLPGHGTQAGDLDAVTADAYLAAAGEAFDRLAAQARAVDLVGFSMGGLIAACLAARRAVRRLVLAAPAFGVRHRWWYGLPAETWARVVSPVVRFVPRPEGFVRVNRVEARPLVPSYDRVPTRSVLALTQLRRRALAPGVLEAVKADTLWCHGPGDEAASARAAGRAYERLGCARREAASFPRSNHLLFWDYERDEVVRRVTAFLSEGPAPRAP